MCCNSIIRSYFDFAQYDKVLNEQSSSHSERSRRVNMINVEILNNNLQ